MTDYDLSTCCEKHDEQISLLTQRIEQLEKQFANLPATKIRSSVKETLSKVQRWLR